MPLGVLALESLHTATGIDQLALACVEGVTLGADFHVYLRHGRTGGEILAAGAAHLGLHVFRMNVFFHVSFLVRLSEQEMIARVDSRW